VSPAALRLEEVSARYGERLVLDGLSLELEAGSVLGVIGPNGAGKSTLLKLISGLVAPSRGRIELFGRPLASLGRRELGRRVAVVPAELTSVFSFSAEEIVWMGRTPHLGFIREPRPADHRAVDQAFALTHSAELRARPFMELSSGERQRVVLAQALAQEPRLLLLDEPTTHLDLAHAMAFLDLVASLVREHGLSAVLVSHDLNQASEYADQLALIDAGRLRAHGRPEEVLDYRTLEAVYSTVVVVKTNPVTGRPHVLPVPRASLDGGGQRKP